MESKCARRVADTECVKRNSFCRILREKAIRKFNEAKQKLMEPLRRAQEAKLNYSLAEFRFQKASLEVGLAGGRVRMLRNSVVALNSAVLIVEQAYRNIWTRLKDAANLRNAWRAAKGVKLINVTEATFDLTVSSKTFRSIPYNITAEAGNQERVFHEVMDFDQDENSLRRAAREILKSFFGNVFAALRENHPYKDHSTRVRRDLGSGFESMTPLIDYKKKCSHFTNYERGISDIFGSLHRLSIKILTQYQKFSEQDVIESSKELEGALVDQQIATKLGISALDIQLSREAVGIDKIVRESNLIRLLESSTSKEQLRLSMELTYRDWLASMEKIFNLTNGECSGFNDCLMDMVDNLYHLYDGVNLPQSKNLQMRVSNIRTLLSEIIGKDDLTVLTAISKTEELLNILNETKRIKVFCAVAPNITEQPNTFTELRDGETLSLSCNADGEPQPSYRWTKDGQVVIGAVTKTLLIKNVTPKDTGVYTCEVANHVGSQKSVPARVVVHTPPIFLQEPPSMVAEVVNAPAFLICNATSTKRPLAYSWYFKQSELGKYNRIPSAVFPILQISQLNRKTEGWYYCNVSNRYGYTVSRTSHVIALENSLVRPAIQMQGYMTVNLRESKSLKSIEDDELEHRLLSRSVKDYLLHLAKLNNATISGLSTSECRLIKAGKTCKLSVTFQGENMTDINTMKNSLEANSMNVLEAVNKLQVAVKSIVVTSQNHAQSTRLRNVPFSLSFNNWVIGDLQFICARGQRLHNNNFICGKRSNNQIDHVFQTLRVRSFL